MHFFEEVKKYFIVKMRQKCTIHKITSFFVIEVCSLYFIFIVREIFETR
jgi:hypothetical protein